VICDKLTITAICTDIELLVQRLLRAATKTSQVFEVTVCRGKLALFEAEANCSLTANPPIAKNTVAAKPRTL